MVDGQLAVITDANFRKRRYTVAAATTISKGILLKMTDPRTAIKADAGSASSANVNPAAGIAGALKESTDGSTSLDVVYDCIAELSASGAINIGQPVVFIVDNYVAAASGNASGAQIAGYAMETASTGEVINVRINL